MDARRRQCIQNGHRVLQYDAFVRADNDLPVRTFADFLAYLRRQRRQFHDLSGKAQPVPADFHQQGAFH